MISSVKQSVLFLSIFSLMIIFILGTASNRVAYSQSIFSDLTDKLKDSLSKSLGTFHITFSKPVELSNRSVTPVPSLLAASENNVYVVWLTGANFASDTHLSLIKSNDSGTNFGELIELDDNISRNDVVQSVAGGRNVYLIWDHNYGTKHTIKFKASNNNGSNFGQTLDLGTIAEFNTPEIVANNNDVYITWLDESDGVSNINLASSVDGGNTFSKKLNIFNSTKLLKSPTLSFNGDNVYVLWKDEVPGNDTLYFVTSHDQGKTFDKVTSIGKSNIGIPRLTSSRNNIYIAWQGGYFGNTHVYLRISHNNGSSFENTLEVGSKNGFSEPLLSASNGNLYIGWIDQTLNESSLKLKASNDSGRTFYQNNYSIKGVNAASNPKILSSDDNAYISWVNSSGIYFKASTDAAKNFDDTQKVVQNSESQLAILPTYASIHNEVYMSWQQLYQTPDSHVGNKLYFMNGNVTGSLSSKGSESNPFANVFGG